MWPAPRSSQHTTSPSMRHDRTHGLDHKRAALRPVVARG